MRPLSYPALGLVLGLTLFFAACERSETPSTIPAHPPEVAPVSKATKAIVQPEVPLRQAQAFAEEWVTAVTNGDSNVERELIAWREILTVAVESSSMDQQSKTAFIEAPLATLGPFSIEIPKVIEAGGEYQLVRADSRDGESFALFRLAPNGGGLDYHLLRLKLIRGRIRADRFYRASTGEEMAETLKYVYGPILTAGESIMGLPTERQLNFINEATEYQKMKTATAAGNAKLALQIYDQLPKSTQKNRLAMSLRIQAASLYPDDADIYEASINDYIEAFPENAACGLLTIEAGVSRQDPKLIKQGYNALNKWTGGDPYLDLMAGAELAVMGQLKEAVELTKAVDPSSMKSASAYNLKLTIALETKDFDEVLKQMHNLVNDFDLNFEEIREWKEFDEFVKSPQFQKWLQD